MGCLPSGWVGVQIDLVDVEDVGFGIAAKLDEDVRNFIITAGKVL